MALVPSFTNNATPRSVAGVVIPDSKLAREVTELVRDTEPPLLFHHSSRVYYWGALTGNRVGLRYDTEHVHLDAGGDERDDGMHVLWDAGSRVQRDRGPDHLDVPLGDAMAPEEIAGGVGAVHLEALVRASVRGSEAHIVEHGAGVKELGIVSGGHCGCR